MFLTISDFKQLFKNLSSNALKLGLYSYIFCRSDLIFWAFSWLVNRNILYYIELTEFCHTLCVISCQTQMAMWLLLNCGWLIPSDNITLYINRLVERFYVGVVGSSLRLKIQVDQEIVHFCNTIKNHSFLYIYCVPSTKADWLQISCQ